MQVVLGVDREEETTIHDRKGFYSPGMNAQSIAQSVKTILAWDAMRRSVSVFPQLYILTTRQKD